MKIGRLWLGWHGGRAVNNAFSRGRKGTVCRSVVLPVRRRRPHVKQPTVSRRSTASLPTLANTTTPPAPCLYNIWKMGVARYALWNSNAAVHSRRYLSVKSQIPLRQLVRSWLRTCSELVRS